MIRALIIYWLIGCICLGINVGLEHTRCPHDEAEGSIEEVLIWPSIFGALLVWHGDEMPACKTKP